MWIEQSKRSRAWTAGIVLAVMANILPARASANAVDDWNVIANQTIIVNGARPGATGIVDFAYVHLAIYDAVNAIDGRYTVFAVRPTTSPHEASPEAATAAAAYTVLRWLFPAQQASLDGAYAAYLTGLPAGPAKTRGIQVGTEVGNAFVLLRTGDGRNAVVTYALGAGPGVYQFTPGCTAVASPWMATMKTFAVTDSTLFRADGPPNLTSQRWAKDFNETKAYGVAAGSLRSPKQTEVGQFYAENPGAWYGRNVRDIAVAKGLSLADAARFYAQIFVTAADALLTTWNSKFYYNFWRPTTAIMHAEIDDNPRTEPDAGWLPLVPTPCHPEYPAAHGAGTGGLAYALAHFFGTEKIAVTLSATSVPTVQPLDYRAFATTQDLVRDVIDGRVFGGMHFRTSGEHGAIIGKSVARYVAKHYFGRINEGRDRDGHDDNDDGRETEELDN